MKIEPRSLTVYDVSVKATPEQWERFLEVCENVNIYEHQEFDYYYGHITVNHFEERQDAIRVGEQIEALLT